MRLFQQIKNSVISTRVLFIIAGMGIVGLAGYSTVAAQTSDISTGGAGYGSTISNTGPGSINTIKIVHHSSIHIQNSTSILVSSNSNQNSSTGNSTVSGNTNGGNASGGSSSNSNSTTENISIQ